MRTPAPLLLAVAAGCAAPAELRVSSPTAEQATAYKLDRSFTAKSCVTQGIRIASSAKVPDLVHREAAHLLDRVLESIDPAVARRVRESGVLCVLLGHEELTSDVPQFAFLFSSPSFDGSAAEKVLSKREVGPVPPHG